MAIGGKCLFAALAVSLLPFGRAHGAAEQRPQARLDAASVTACADDLAQGVREAIRAAGGDPQHESIKLVLAFSTGHFGNDPLRARAAREVASAFLNRFPVTSGDRVLVYA